MIGQTVGSYRIAAKLGAGGMGEVFRATDTRLGRDVAIKFSAEQFNERFEREARAVAALNHPNICTLHDVGPNFLVMELIEGPTLAERIAQGPIPMDEALGIAMQIAAALEAAHEKNIVHRDLKPGNIKIKPDGTVKVLDFGLAKVGITPVAPSNDSPTIDMAATQAGMILGTAAYMSPEQARCKPVDRHADIWAFGVVLFEMLTGRRLFEGGDITETLAAVIKDEPDWNQAPPKVRRLLQRCLQKDPKKRLHDIADMGLLLEEAPQVAVTKNRTMWAMAGVLVIIVAVLAGALWLAMRRVEPTLQQLVDLDVDLGPDVSLDSQAGADTIISPDGTRLVYVSQSRLFTRRLDQPKATVLLGTEGAYAPFFKPDGLWVAFFAGGKLKKISVEGGTAAELCNASGGRGGSWGEDGYIVATLGNVVASLSRIPDSGGNPEPFTEFQHGEISHRWPQVLPGGKAVLFTASSSSTSYYEANIEVVSLGDHHRKTLQKGGTYGRYVATSNAAGYLVYLNHATLYAVSFDPDLLETRGTPMPVLNEVGYTASNGTAQFDFSRTGTLMYRGGGGTGGGLFNVQWLDPAGNTQPLLPKLGAYQNLSVSPVGNRLAIEFTGKIAVYDWQNEQTTPLSFDGGDPTYPLWSPDGKYIVFQAPGGMFWTRADGASKPQQLTQSKNLQFPSSFTLDGKRLAFIESSPDNLYDIWTVPVKIDGAGMRADGNAEPFLQTPAYEVYPSFSPDGKWLAYFSNDGGTSHIYVKAFPDNRERSLISSAGGMHPVWSRKEKKLFFRTDGNQIMVADYVVEGDKFVAHKAHIWSEKRLANIGLAMNFDLAPDGRVAAFMPVEQPGEQKAENHVTFMLNFFDEMRRRLGSK